MAATCRRPETAVAERKRRRGEAAVAWTDERARSVLRRLFDAALAAADPLACLAPHLPAPPAAGRVVVVGCGKAAAKMAAAVEAAWQGVPLSGLVVTTYGADLPHPPAARRIALRFASHPVPDANGAGRRRPCSTWCAG